MLEEKKLKLIQSLVNEGLSYKKIAKRIGRSKTSVEVWMRRRGLKTKNNYNKGNPKYQKIEKVCPVCDKTFQTKSGHPKEKTVCSRACANTYFRSGENHGAYKPEIERYRNTCFQVHPYKCIICGFDITVDVHHINGNHGDNSKENLVPLCPNHHRMAHMNNYKAQVDEIIQEKLRGVRLVD